MKLTTQTLTITSLLALSTFARLSVPTTNPDNFPPSLENPTLPTDDLTAANSTDPLARREQDVGARSSLSVTTYYGHGCQGYGVQHPSVQYSYQYVAGINSYYLSRDQGPQEQFDLSKLGSGGNPPACGTFIEARFNMPKGCHAVKETASCFRFWHY